VFPQRTRVRVRLITAGDPAVVGLVAGVHVGMLLAIRTVGEPPVTARVLALERLLPWGQQTGVKKLFREIYSIYVK
jgi:hypothetical protein